MKILHNICFDCNKEIKNSYCKCLSKYNITYLNKSNYYSALYIYYVFSENHISYAFDFTINEEKIYCEFSSNDFDNNYDCILSDYVIINDYDSLKELVINLQSFCKKYLNNLIFI